jgi:ataxia telangiectasia mutated family protein
MSTRWLAAFPELAWTYRDSVSARQTRLPHVSFILGVAFEQGKILPTPETVPFRLSRDIVDGMGITGVEGVFRR